MIKFFLKKNLVLYDKYMKYKYEDEKYSLEEVKNSRLVLKNNNGLIFCSDIFYEMYPDITFIGLVRHPIALYESHKRRKTPVSVSIKAFAKYYSKMTKKMIEDQDNIENYHIIKFENLLTDPIESMKKLYSWAHIDSSQLKQVRLKAKKYMHEDGEAKHHMNLDATTGFLKKELKPF